MNMHKPPDETLKQGRNRSWLLVNFSDVIIIGGYHSTIRQRFQNSLVLVREKFLNEDKHESSPLNYLFLQLYRAIKVSNVSWSTGDKNEYYLNEQFIDVLIAHEEGGSFHFFIRQYVHLVDNPGQSDAAVNEHKRSGSPFSDRLQQSLTVYDTAKNGRNTITTKWTIYTA